MENSVVIISAVEYEQLVRDSEKVRILTQAILDKANIGNYWSKCILGLQHED